MRKRIPSVFGKTVLNKLIETGMTQEELISAIKNSTGMFLDGSYLYKILTDQRSAPKIVQAIREILDLPEQDNPTT